MSADSRCLRLTIQISDSRNNNELKNAVYEELHAHCLVPTGLSLTSNVVTVAFEFSA